MSRILQGNLLFFLSCFIRFLMFWKVLFPKTGTNNSQEGLVSDGPSLPLSHIYPAAPARTGFKSRSIFKRCLTGLYSELCFSLIGCLTKSTQLFIPNWEENCWILTFSKGISAMLNANSLTQDLNLGRNIHFSRGKLLHHECLIFQLYNNGNQSKMYC